MTESGRGGAPYSKRALSSGGRAAALQAAGHRFESDRVHATSSRALHKTPVRSRRRDFLRMITRQDKQRVLEALDERLWMELLLNPVDALCHPWDYGHYRTFRRLVWASDWVGLARALDACPETTVVETTRTLIKEASPRLYAMVTS